MNFHGVLILWVVMVGSRRSSSLPPNDGRAKHLGATMETIADRKARLWKAAGDAIEQAMGDGSAQGAAATTPRWRRCGRTGRDAAIVIPAACGAHHDSRRAIAGLRRLAVSPPKDKSPGGRVEGGGWSPPGPVGWYGKYQIQHSGAPSGYNHA